MPLQRKSLRKVLTVLCSISLGMVHRILLAFSQSVMILFIFVFFLALGCSIGIQFVEFFIHGIPDGRLRYAHVSKAVISQHLVRSIACNLRIQITSRNLLQDLILPSL